MAKRDKALSYTFRGTPERLEKLQESIKRALESAMPKIDLGGPVEDWGQNGGWVQDLGDHWGQSGGWYLVVGDSEAVKVARPVESITSVTKTFYQAVSKAEQQR